jgi:RNA polymerase sigma-70 factor (sigma-E family)
VSAPTGSFDAFVRDSQAALVRYAMLLCGSVAPAEDLVQDVLIKVYLRWDRIVAGDGDVYAYVRRAVTNEFLSWRRRWSTRHIRLVDAATLNAVSVDPWTGTHDDELWQRLMQLPGQQRAAVVLRYYEDLDDAEIADTLGCRPATVRAHVSRGLAALRQASRDDVESFDRRQPDA